MIEDVGARAVARMVTRLADAASLLPEDVAIEAVEGGVVLTGRALSRRRIEDARLRDFAIVGARR